MSTIMSQQLSRCRVRAVASESTAGTEAGQNQVQRLSLGSALQEPSGESLNADMEEPKDDDIPESIWMEALKGTCGYHYRHNAEFPSNILRCEVPTDEGRISTE